MGVWGQAVGDMGVYVWGQAVGDRRPWGQAVGDSTRLGTGGRGHASGDMGGRGQASGDRRSGTGVWGQDGGHGSTDPCLHHRVLPRLGMKLEAGLGAGMGEDAAISPAALANWVEEEVRRSTTQWHPIATAAGDRDGGGVAPCCVAL